MDYFVIGQRIKERREEIWKPEWNFDSINFLLTVLAFGQWINRAEWEAMELTGDTNPYGPMTETHAKQFRGALNLPYSTYLRMSPAGVGLPEFAKEEVLDLFMQVPSSLQRELLIFMQYAKFTLPAMGYK